MSSGRRQYPFHLIELKWQQHWDEQQTFRAFNPGDEIPAGHPFAERHKISGSAPAGRLPPKFYILDMFPYPSGAGLHVGHPEGYTATDILARYRRARGFNVLHPMGWDAFGLPAEQYAIKTGQHPRKTTEENIANFKRQIKSLGFSYDWSREVATTDPDYFKWTQWIFLKLYNSYFDPHWSKATPIALLEDALSVNPQKEDEWRNNPHLWALNENYGKKLSAHPLIKKERAEEIERSRLAYVTDAPVWWCEALGTVLANEEVVDGRSEVGGHPVTRKPMRQWMLRITKYAERLLTDLDTIDWSDSLKEMQRNWIGRSEGAEVFFGVSSSKGSVVISVFTTRPDTLFGATYLVLAPEHKLVEAVTEPAQLSAVQSYKAAVARKSDLERTELAKEKTGVFTGAYALNPVNREVIPIWIADYVLASYGTGAIMAVPAHDTRDLEFATKFNLPVVQVVQPPDPKTEWRGFVDDGTSVNSTGPEISITGLPTAEAKKKITDWLEAKAEGQRMINYKLRDWLFSRQRYWGEPFPIVWKRDANGNLYHEALPESALPVLPPTLEDYKPTPDGQPPLARAKDWVTLPDGSTRETNTMPQWAGSCWYYLRYLNAKNAQAFVGKEAESYWIGAAEQRAVGILPADQTQISSAAETAGSTLKTTPGVDLYVGGTEHAVLHLLYARFWHKVLFDLGYVSTPEPFFKLVNQGLILGELEYFGFKLNGDLQGPWFSAELVTEMTAHQGAVMGKHRESGDIMLGVKIPEELVEPRGGHFYLKSQADILLDARSFKMSKSRDNVVNPDHILKEYGADAFRLYEMFLGPLQDTKPWSTKNVEGVYRFLGRVWRLFVDEKSEVEFEQTETTTETQRCADLLNIIKLSPAIKHVQPTAAQLRSLHACIKKVTEDLDGMRFNTAISAMMEFVNDALHWETKPVSVLRDFLVLLAPFAPHIAEELWDKLHSSLFTHHSSLSYAPWPKFDPALLVESEIEIPVQVNGKLRDVVKVTADSDNATMEAAARASEKVQQFIVGKTIKKVIVVPKKLVNIAVG